MITVPQNVPKISGAGILLGVGLFSAALGNLMIAAGWGGLLFIGLGVGILAGVAVSSFGSDLDPGLVGETPADGDNEGDATDDGFHTSPLVLDLDGDGVEAGGITHFDYDGDGFSELSRYMSEDDGILVLDLNDNGIIDNGSEMFGDNTLVNGSRAENGFIALGQHDSNGDGVISALDNKFDDLRIMRWTDTDSDGYVDDNEIRLELLADSGISEIKLAYENSDTVDSYKNEHRQVGSYVTDSEITRTITDVWFKTDGRFTIYDHSLIPIHSETVSGLQNIRGIGMVYDLRDAMALDDASRLLPPFYSNTRTETRTLSQLIVAFNSATDTHSRDELANKILFRWTGAEGAKSADYWREDSQLLYTTPEKIAVTEAFRGKQWEEGQSYRNPTRDASAYINYLYHVHFEFLRSNLLLQGHFKEAYDAISLKYMGVAITEETDLSEATESDLAYDLSAAVTLMSGKTVQERNEFIRSLAVLDAMPGFRDGIVKTASSWLYEFDYHVAYLNYMVGAIGTAATRYQGTDGQDTIRPTAAEAEGLRGGEGSDTYQLEHGTGIDLVHEDLESQGTDVIMVTPGVARSDIRLRRDEHHLWIEILGEGSDDGSRPVSGGFQVPFQYSAAGSRIEQVRFGDGTIFYVDDINDIAFSGNARNDYIHGRDYMGDIFDSDAGGNDNLRGRGGDDTYRLGPGTGFDVIDEGASRGPASPSGDDGDVILVESGYSTAAGNVRLRRPDEWSLVVELVDDAGMVTDHIWVHRQFDGGAFMVEEVRFEDNGDVWGTVDFAAAALRGYGGNDRINGRDDMGDVFDADIGGNDELRGRGGDDTYKLGPGTGFDVIDEGSLRGTASPAGDNSDVIMVESGYSVASGIVRLRRPDEWSLVVELLDGAGTVTDHIRVHRHFDGGAFMVEEVRFEDSNYVWDTLDFAAAALRGYGGNDRINGRDDMGDVFDSDAGGNDQLRGRGGDDIYQLGPGTGFDVVEEGTLRGPASPAGDDGDLILVESGFSIASGNVRLRQDGNHLVMELLGEAASDGSRPVSDRILVHRHFSSGVHAVEVIEFEDSDTTWTGDFRIGTSASETLTGGSGSDVYYLESGFGDDRVVDTGGTDTFVLSGVDKDDVRITKSGSDLSLSVSGTTDRAVFANWGVPGGANKVERIEVGGDFITAAQVDRMISAMATFTQGGGSPSMFDTTSNDYWDPIAAA